MAKFMLSLRDENFKLLTTTILAGIFVLLIIGLNIMLLYFTFTGAS